jgi:aquaporin Z
VIGHTALPPIAIGLMLMAMIYAGGHISGAHYNPAVTLALWLRGKCEGKDILPYIISQILGAVLAALSVQFLRGVGAGGAEMDTAKIIAGELLGSFALVWVILNVATAKGTEGNSFYGAAIGLTVTAGAYAFGDLSGAVFNPAVAIGLVILQLMKVKYLWLYLVASPVAALLATKAFQVTQSDKA